METWRTARLGLTTMRRAMLGLLAAAVLVVIAPYVGVVAVVAAMGALLIGSLMFTFGMPSYAEARRLALTAFFIGILGAVVQYLGNNMRTGWYDDGLNFLQFLGMSVSAVAMALHFGAWKKIAID